LEADDAGVTGAIRKDWFWLPLLFCSLLLAAAPAGATLLNVQILGHAGNAGGGPDNPPPAYRGAGAVGGEEDFWNGIRAESFNQPLQISPPVGYLASDGATPLPVRIKFKGFNAADHWPTADGAAVNHALMNSYLVAGPGASVTIEGLRPGKNYDLWLFGNNSRAGAGAKFSVNGRSPQATQGKAGTAFTQGTDYVEFKNLAADDAGRLKIVFDAANPAIFAGAILNGLQLRGEFPPRGTAVSPESDPNRWALKCWLKAEDLAAAGSRPGDVVRVWQDAAWGLRFMPDSNPPRADAAPVYAEVAVPDTTNRVSVVQFNGESGLQQIDSVEARDEEVTAYIIFRTQDSPRWKKLVARRDGALCTYDGDVSSALVPRGYHTAYRENGIRLGAADRLPVALTGHQGEYNRDSRFRGEIAEVIVFARHFRSADDQSLSTEQQAVETYLAAKYFKTDERTAKATVPWQPKQTPVMAPSTEPVSTAPRAATAMESGIGLPSPNVFSQAARSGGEGSFEYAAGDVTLPFSYKAEVSTRPRPEPLNFPGQHNPDCCHAFVKIDGELWMFRIDFIADKGRIGRFKGPNIDTMTQMEDGTYPPEVGLGWLLGGLWYDQAERKLYAPVHIEQEGNYRFHPAWGWFSRKIGLATSVDKGKTWKYEGDIITPETYYHTRDAYKFSGSDTSNGMADFGFYVDTRGGYFYIYPLESWYPKGEWGARWAPRVARCAISDKMAPGKWQYFYQGRWDQPALGGKSSIVGASYFWGILYSTKLKRYVSISPYNKDPWWPPSTYNVDGVIIGTCTDLSKQDWVWGHFPEGMHGFMKLFSATGDDIETCDDRLRFYSFFADNSYQNLDVTLLDAPMQVNQGTPRFGFQPNPESSDPILSRRTKMVGSASPEMKYAGAWKEKTNPKEYYEGRLRESSTPGDSVEFHFTGPDIYWRAVRSPESGQADVYLDGEYRKTVDCYSPRATVSENFVYIKTGLDSAKPHTIKIVVKGARHPKSKGNAIGHMAFEFAAESHRASSGFSSIMGKNHWRYLQRAGEVEERLRFLPSDEVFTRDWQGEGAVRIGNNYQIPDAGHAAVRQWVAPHAGTVRVEGEVTYDPPGGTSARLLKGKEELWPAGSGSSAGPVQHDLKIEVAQGEKIDFVAAVMKGGTGKVFWDPVITYTRSEPPVFRPNPPSDENLALGKYARSKMLSFAAQPFHAVDGDLRSAFSIYPDDRIASGDDWLQVDLDRPQTIDRYVLVSAPPVKGWRPVSFTLQRSDDGFAWTDVDKVTANQDERCDRKVPAFTARYVRLYLPKGKPFTIQELELYRDGDSFWGAKTMDALRRAFRRALGKDG
jgi:hypothetical protein